MNVRKRSGQLVPVQPEKIMEKLLAFSYDLSLSIDIEALYNDIRRGLYDGVETTELDSHTAEQAAARAAMHPDYAVLAGRIAMNALVKRKGRPTTFSAAMSALHKNRALSGEAAPLVSDALMALIAKNPAAYDNLIAPERDYNFDYFGFKTLEKSYLLRLSNGEVVETPQMMYLRVACQLHAPNMYRVQETYDILSLGYATHATPTLFNAGTPNAQMASCFLLTMQDDSIKGIFNTLSQCASISKWAGGIGLSISNIRAKGSYIRGTGGYSNGIVPMLRVFNDTARYVDQGGNKRKGSFAVYLEPHHPDILDFLELKKNHGKEEARARDLFLALWISDYFMECVEADKEWALFCPSICPDLQDAVGDDYKAKCQRYLTEGKASKVVKAREIWQAITTAQIETGTPYMLYKDAANKKSNQRNLGTIRSSNLCTEIIQYSSPEEIATCNLASIALPKFVVNGRFDFEALGKVVRVLVLNCNIVIDENAYPANEARNSNLLHRPIGLGVQGLADVFAMLKMPFDSMEAKALNALIFENIYFYALDASCALAYRDGAYSSYRGSPASKGLLQMDLWGVPTTLPEWPALRQRIAEYGLRNSLLIAPMPTASTAQILGNNECFEPFSSNIYNRHVLSGSFVQTNKHLVKDLEALGLWTNTVRQAIIAANGSVQGIDAIPEDIKAIYKTAYEISQRAIIDMAADRGAFICQSQSLNLFVAEPTHAKLTSMHFYAWKKGLKTGMYYLRSKAAADPIKFTLDAAAPKACSLDNPDCESCSS